MKNATSTESLLPRNPVPEKSMSSQSEKWTLDELLERSGITRRQFSQMLASGAAEGPKGHGRHARYGHQHLAQIKMVLVTQERFGLSRAAACSAVGSERAGHQRSPKVQSTKRTAAMQCFKGTVHSVSPGVFLVCSENLPAIERTLVAQAKKYMSSKWNSMNAACKPASSKLKSVIYKSGKKQSGE
ncbi:hypothetical protein LNV23_06635 [Paucibacter sp. DJ1R-11]|uniref:hypothetical protein n=1 Tax=Paucibacter sp. DJ1R-11 TaxID=2893556 RepID=UPI0021E3F34E|nr:hypothetical protein [Paucibacter sp. DJ1R-11]MCV2363132.1 hypothetical protein [Paucibacter sp. DJ1R-11]